MRKILFLFIFLTQPLYAEKVKTTYNPFLGKLDYITQLDSSTIPLGSTFYAAAGPVVILHGDGTSTLFQSTDSTPGGLGATLIRSTSTLVDGGRFDLLFIRVYKSLSGKFADIRYVYEF